MYVPADAAIEEESFRATDAAALFLSLSLSLSVSVRLPRWDFVIRFFAEERLR